MTPREIAAENTILEQPDYKVVNDWLINVYPDYWSEEGKWGC